MISSLKNLPFKFIRYNKFIVLSSIFSIVISVALIISMFMFTNSAERTMSEKIKDLYGNVDISISYNTSTGKVIDKQLVDSIKAINGVDEVSQVIVGRLYVGSSSPFSVYSVGVDNSGLSKTRYKYKQDIAENQIIINDSLAKRLMVDREQALVINGKSFTVIDTFEDINQSASVPDVVLINIKDIRELLKADLEATHLMIDIMDTVDGIDVAKELKGIDNDLVVDLVEEDEFIRASIDSAKTFMIILSVLVIIMCALFINSNFQSFLYKYRNQFALIRAIGGSSKQAFNIVFIQCTFINSIGVLMGLLCSILSSRYLTGFLNNQFNLQADGSDFSFKIALVISLILFISIELFMLFPAIKSSKILPLKIMEENEQLEGMGNLGKIAGILGIVISFILMGVGIKTALAGGTSIGFGILSSIFLIIGVFVLFPYYTRHLLTAVLPIAQLFAGSGAVVAIKNLIPQVRKSTVIIIAVSTMVMIAVFGSTFFNTILVNNEKYLKSQFATEIVVTDRDSMQSQLDSSFKSSLINLNGVHKVSVLSNNSQLYFKAKDGLSYVEYCYADLTNILQSETIRVINGSVNSGVVITKPFADSHSLKAGDTIYIRKLTNNKEAITEINPEIGFEGLTIGAIIEDFSIRPGASLILDWDNSNYINESTTFYKALIESSNTEATLKGLADLKGQYPQIKWATLTQALRESRQVMTQRWILFIIVVAAILLSLTLGIINILMNNILTKRKEYAVLRTLKLNQRGLLNIIITQVVVYILTGAGLGLVLGTIISNIISLTENVHFAYVDFRLMLIIMCILMLICLLVFIPLGLRLANRKIADEVQIEMM